MMISSEVGATSLMVSMAKSMIRSSSGPLTLIMSIKPPSAEAGAEVASRNATSTRRSPRRNMPRILRRDEWGGPPAQQTCDTAKIATLPGMPRVLVVADTPWVVNDVKSALSLPGFELTEHDDPRNLVAAMAEHRPDVAVVDLQVGSMGGMAITRSIKNASQAGDLPEVPVVLLLDRAADGFLAKRAAAHSWLVKPFDPHQLREALDAAIGSKETTPQP